MPRLQTLAMEWGMLFLPEEFEMAASETLVIENIKQALIDSEPGENALLIPLTFSGMPYAGEADEGSAEEASENEGEESAEAEAEPAAEADESTDSEEETSADEAPAEEPAEESAEQSGLNMGWFLLPVNSLPVASVAASDESAEEVTATDAPEMPPEPQDHSILLPGPRERVANLTVNVAVHLAEKKIPVAQLLGLSPGALITFNKSCEDLLDLYVNNHCYCRGEAVKIGEKFGLKVNEIGAQRVRESRVF